MNLPKGIRKTKTEEFVISLIGPIEIRIQKASPAYYF